MATAGVPARRALAESIDLGNALAVGDAATRELVARWGTAANVVVLTGAGLSTASGIPDFRSPGGRWSRYQPIPYPSFLSDEEARREYWRYKGETWSVFSAARPNPGHLALARLGLAGRIELLVTQNVDGLHERSQFPPQRLINIHGTDSEVVCVGCSRREPRSLAQDLLQSGQEIPLCDCGSAWKPATISFGQALVEADLMQAFGAATTCDVFVAVGTSLVVSPVNEMFALARSAGAFTAILTISDTPFDAQASYRNDAPLEEVLPAIADAVLE